MVFKNIFAAKYILIDLIRNTIMLNINPSLSCIIIYNKIRINPKILNISITIRIFFNVFLLVLF